MRSDHSFFGSLSVKCKDRKEMQIMAWMKRQWAGKCRHLYTDKVEQVMKLTEIYQNKKNGTFI